ncbi:flagellar basal body P-ring formation chaperone FlgA [Pseudoalteromonas denitrificans]|uniref:Flagella basal body P-ring formation protein FlgA n=1 Tax=Pseudoalteromonas denitrificans DSM 6059 TaxID=1123010 RepID=A0A1I1HNW3_9GAMM|nr:flagellar basal body P-ring formation chaperone FlgA [Pseudoalteromonas denitrificans]SFC25252.1 flagella basal body P-ring formation protein FlgA [Pseudoalteromonas denitrificans DSM 6059]
MSLFKKNHHKFIFFMLLALLSNNIAAKIYSKNELQLLAINYVKQHLPELSEGKRELSALSLDSRIPDKNCETQLLINSARSQRSNRQSTIQIKCLDEKKWHIYVQVKIIELSSIVVINKNIIKGEIISKEHLSMQSKQKHLIRNQYLDKNDIQYLIGSRSKRNIKNGSAITYNQVCMVCKGDKVTIFAKFKGLSVKTTGFALQDGILDQRISVKNAKSGKTLHVKVLGVDRVQVSI